MTFLYFDCRFIGKSSSLPTTSYVKMVDVWLITTMLFPFIEIAGLAYRTSLRGQLSRSTPVRSLCKEGAPPHLHTRPV